MDWQGIPFKLIETDSLHRTFLNVSHIPDIVIQTGFSWDSLISGLVAGAIPAIVAVIAMRSNSKNIQDERRHQLELANKNITTQIVSASRQVWINDLREAAASYMGAVTCTVNALNFMCVEIASGKGTSDFYIKQFNEQSNAKRELGLLTSKIGLLLNPEEESSKRAIKALEKIRRFLLRERAMDELISFDELEPLALELRQSIYAVVKNEWRKVKNDNP
ncbi:hypothetical protein [Citrobacter cronae]|uniref:Uncharacterized protein n=1 Tax=Citrobacter cronae TaxID=1748967 RepID=A0A7X1BL77_9ENTR|nr:hypothetical protein [Citrobacter cronae]MBC2619004.1 hypothetical protein [Citrobacter cronae]